MSCDIITPGIVGDISVVGEDNGGVAGKTADVAADVRKGEVNDITGDKVDTTIDETADVVDDGAAADDRNREVNDGRWG